MLPLARAADAHRLLEASEHFGKVVLRVAPALKSGYRRAAPRRYPAAAQPGGPAWISPTPAKKRPSARACASGSRRTSRPASAPGTEDLRAWQRRLHQAGFLGAAWPKEHGGAGLSPMEQAILNEELARANAPAPLGSMGISWVGPAILRFGTEEQKRSFVPRLLAGDDIWATGYSEPGAGSDMYNTQTRAVRDGDSYVINGQKIWTSLAHVSNWYFLLCRTSSEGHKVAGLIALPDADADARDRDPPDQDDHGRYRVQRGVPEGRARAGGLGARAGKGRATRWSRAR